MKNINIIFLALILFVSCQNDKRVNNEDILIETSTNINPFDDFKQIDMFLKNLSDKPQFFTVPSNKKTKIIGKNRIIIYVNPKNLNTVDNSMIGDSIRVELIEMIDKASLIKNNAQTISNGNILVSGGAYYINMTSNNRQLTIKEKGLKVEFPKLSDDEMDLFIGIRDSLNQMNWKSLNQNLKIKNIKDPVMPSNPDSIDYTSVEIVEIIDGEELIKKPKEIKAEDVTKEEYEKYQQELKEYHKKIRKIRIERKTYQAINILDFGWINCDRFYRINSPKTNIEFLVKDTTIRSAKFFAVFKEIKSIMSNNYNLQRKRRNEFVNIPVNSEITIIGISLKDTIPYYFEKEIKVDSDTKIFAEFVKTKQEDIERKINELK